MYEPKFLIFMSFLSIVNTYTFSNKTNCQTLNTTEIEQLPTNSYKTEAIKPHKIFEVITNFLGVFSQNEKSLNYQKYKKFQSSVDCYNEGCQFLTVYHYLTHFKEYINQIMNILKSAFDENAELFIAEGTIFIKIPEQKYQHITKIKFQCVPTSQGKIFTLKSLKHKNGTILATEFHGKNQI